MITPSAVPAMRTFDPPMAPSCAADDLARTAPRQSGQRYTDPMIEVTLLGTGSPIPDANRAGPSTLVRAGGQTFLIDCGRGVQQRMMAVGVGSNSIAALLLTHLHSDHIADLGDVIITRWVTTFDPNAPALPIIGPPGTAEVVDATLKAFGHDIGYRIAHHADITGPPRVEVEEVSDGVVWDS